MNEQKLVEGLQLLYQKIDAERVLRMEEWNRQLAIQLNLSEKLSELDDQRRAITHAIEVISHG